MGPFKKKKHEKQRLLSDDFDDDEEEQEPKRGSKGAHDGNDFFSTEEDDFDIQPTGADFEAEFEPKGSGAFDSGGAFESGDPGDFPSSADPELPSSGDAEAGQNEESEGFDPENFHPKDLGTCDEPFELVIKDLDKERELVDKGEDPKAATMLVDFPSKEEAPILLDFPSTRKPEPEPEPEKPEAAPNKKGRRMRRFSLGAKPVDDESDNKDKEPSAQVGHFGEFEASFSALALELGEDGETKKKKKGIKKIFGKGKDPDLKKPVGHSAEIVVDKSKIPTQKIPPEMKDGELFVNFPTQDDEEEHANEKEKKSGRFKSLKKSIKKKVGRSTRNLTADVELSDGEDDEDRKQSAESRNYDGSEHESDVLIPGSDEEELGKDSESGGGDPYKGLHDDAADGRRRQIRTRRRLSVSGTSGSSHEVGTAVERRARRRGTDARLLRSKTEGATKEEGQDGRQARRHRHSTMTSDRPRRQTLLEKHQAGTHGPRLTNRSKHSERDDSTTGSTDSTNQGEESVASGEASVDKASKPKDHRGSSRNEEALKVGGRRALLNKAKSRRRVDSLGSDKSGGRRVPPSDALKRRAMSTRKIGLTPPPNDTHAHSSQHNNPHRVVSDNDRRKRMSRQFMSERHIGGKPGKPGLMSSSAHEATDDMKMSRSDHNRNAGGNLFSNEEGQVHGWARNIVNAGNNDKKAPTRHSEGQHGQRDHHHHPRHHHHPGETSEKEERKTHKQSTSDAISGVLASENLSKEEVEKLVRVVALQAKDAKSTEDIESIVMGALRGGLKCQDETSNREESKSSDMHMESDSSFVGDSDDDITLRSDGGSDNPPTTIESHQDEDGKILSPSVIHDKTRNYVQSFLKEENIGVCGLDMRETDESEKSSSHQRNLKNNYAQVFMNIDASVRESGSMQDESKRSSMRDESRQSLKDESKRNSMKDRSERGSMKDSSKRDSRSDVANVLSKLEQAKARSQEMAKSRTKTQTAK